MKRGYSAGILTVEFLNDEMKKVTEQMTLVRDVLLELQNRKPETLNEDICIRYLKEQSIVKITEDFNNKGMRIKTDSYIGERKYNTNDISEVIKEESIKPINSSDLSLFTKILFYYNKNKKTFNDVYKVAKRIKL